jgi:DNA-binding transcriptional ArsR family regulator
MASTDLKLDQTLLALADPTRRRVIDLLRRKPQRAGDLAAALDISPPRLSRHLRTLRRSGLIEDGGVDHDARVSLYRLKPEPFETLRDWLDQVEAFWTAELASFKAHAEAPAAMRARGHAKPRASINVSSRWGWGPSASERRARKRRQ